MTASPSRSAPTATAFLQAVLPEPAPHERIQLTAKGRDGGVENVFSPDIAGIIEAARRLRDTHHLWFGVALRDGARGDTDHVSRLGAIWADVDVKCFPDGKAGALAALDRLPLPPSLVVDTGHGFNTYWLLREPVTAAEDGARARAAMRGIRAFLSEGLAQPLDPVHDLRRVLRLPRSLNHKDAPPLPVQVVRFEPARRYDLVEFEEAGLWCELPDLEPREAEDFPPTDAHAIAAKCAWFRHCIEDAAELGEPAWYAFLGIVGRCEDGERLAHEWSAPYPTYTPEETASKLRHALTAAGPASCERIAVDLDGGPYCQGCRFRGKVRSPIVLGMPQDPAPVGPPEGGGPPEAEPVRYRLTDYGNAERFAAQHGRNVRFCHPWGCWLVWDGRRWVRDDTAAVWRLAKETVRSIYQEAADEPDEERRKLLAKHAAASESGRRIAEMLRLAQSEPGIPVLPEELDADPWLLNVLNGTLDLRTGELRPHRREDLITKLAPVAYDPDADAPTFRAFLERILDGNAALAAFLQRAVGYALTGSTREQALFLWHGTGANGKSTLLGVLQDLLGDYAAQTPMDTLMVRKGDAIPNDLARLRGARFVAAVEADEGRRLAESVVKQLTGGDRIAARFMRAEWFEFTPTFKLFLAVNHKPVIRGTDHAIWRRIRLVPFTVTIPPEEQDRDLAEKLRAELPGILAWAVAGCLAWQRDGLGLPHEVQAATDAYRNEMDVLADFLEERCTLHPTASVTKAALYQAYTEWCDSAGERPLPKKLFGTRMSERGFQERRLHGGARWWVGIAIQGDIPPDGGDTWMEDGENPETRMIQGFPADGDDAVTYGDTLSGINAHAEPHDPLNPKSVSPSVTRHPTGAKATSHAGSAGDRTAEHSNGGDTWPPACRRCGGPTAPDRPVCFRCQAAALDPPGGASSGNISPRLGEERA